MGANPSQLEYIQGLVSDQETNFNSVKINQDRILTRLNDVSSNIHNLIRRGMLIDVCVAVGFGCIIIILLITCLVFLVKQDKNSKPNSFGKYKGKLKF